MERHTVRWPLCMKSASASSRYHSGLSSGIPPSGMASRDAPPAARTAGQHIPGGPVRPVRRLGSASNKRCPRNCDDGKGNRGDAQRQLIPAVIARAHTRRTAPTPRSYPCPITLRNSPDGTHRPPAQAEHEVITKQTITPNTW